MGKKPKATLQLEIDMVMVAWLGCRYSPQDRSHLGLQSKIITITINVHTTKTVHKDKADSSTLSCKDSVAQFFHDYQMSTDVSRVS